MHYKDYEGKLVKAYFAKEGIYTVTGKLERVDISYVSFRNCEILGKTGVNALTITDKSPQAIFERSGLIAILLKNEEE